MKLDRIVIGDSTMAFMACSYLLEQGETVALISPFDSFQSFDSLCIKPFFLNNPKKFLSDLTHWFADSSGFVRDCRYFQILSSTPYYKGVSERLEKSFLRNSKEKYTIVDTDYFNLLLKRSAYFSDVCVLDSILEKKDSFVWNLDQGLPRFFETFQTWIDQGKLYLFKSVRDLKVSLRQTKFKLAETSQRLISREKTLVFLTPRLAQKLLSEASLKYLKSRYIKRFLRENFYISATLRNRISDPLLAIELGNSCSYLNREQFFYHRSHMRGHDLFEDIYDELFRIYREDIRLRLCQRYFRFEKTGQLRWQETEDQILYLYGFEGQLPLWKDLFHEVHR